MGALGHLRRFVQKKQLTELCRKTHAREGCPGRRAGDGHT
jgi:hypothetical protein